MSDYRITMLRAPFFRWHAVIVFSNGTQLIADPSFWRPLAREKAVRVADAFSKAVGR